MIINDIEYRLGQALPSEINSAILYVSPNEIIVSQSVTQLKAWLNDFKSKLKCEYITYNGTLIKSSELKSF